MQLPLLPLPAGILSEWVPIADANYVRPAHSGEYDISPKYVTTVRVRYCADSDTWACDGGEYDISPKYVTTVRVRYCADSDTWACDGGALVWGWALAWRGCTVPFVDTAL